MESDLLDRWNPWWNDGEVPEHLRGVKRDLTAELGRPMEMREVLTLVGVRRCGKSTMMYQLIDDLLRSGVPPKNILMVNLEDPRFIGTNIGEILSAYRQRMVPQGRMYIFLDEVQMSPEWERWVYSEYERRHDEKFIVTGSSFSVIMSKWATLLTGRVFEYFITPLSFSEFLRFRGVTFDGVAEPMHREGAMHELDEYMRIGGFPEAVLERDASPTETLERYLDSILYRDVIFRHGVDPEKLTRLALYVLSNIGTLQSQRSLADACSMDGATVGTYLWHLEQAMLIIPVEPLTFKTRPKVRMRLPTKYYCMDTGLRNAVARRPTPDEGRLAENLVCLRLGHGHRRPLYWRNRGEVDFVTGLLPSELTAINVCYSDRVPEREYIGLESFRRHVRPPHGPPLMITRSLEDTVRGVRHVPLHLWLLEPEKPEFG